MLPGIVEPNKSYYSKEIMLLLLGFGFVFTLMRAQRRINLSKNEQIEV